jgi:prepilin-type N-terminal cleavage/methylation domain-containing protein
MIMSKKDSIADVMIKPPEVEKRTGKPRTHDRGFTLIEIVVVLIVLFIMTAVIASKTFTTGTADDYDLMVEIDGLKASLRFAQIQSLAAAYKDTSGNEKGIWGIHFPDATSYKLYKDGEDAKYGPDDKLVMIPVEGYDDPDDEYTRNWHKFKGDIRMTSPSPPKTINFDKWGRPMDGITLLNADFPIILSRGAGTKTITIAKNTGYIP